MQLNANQPKTFLEALFDTSVWTTLAQETNNYTWQSIANKQGISFKDLLIYIYLLFFLKLNKFIFSFTFTTVISYKMKHSNSLTKSKIAQDITRQVLMFSHPKFCEQSGYLLALLFAF